MKGTFTEIGKGRLDRWEGGEYHAIIRFQGEGPFNEQTTEYVTRPPKEFLDSRYGNTKYEPAGLFDDSTPLTFTIQLANLGIEAIPPERKFKDLGEFLNEAVNASKKLAEAIKAKHI